jgi:uncharacterized membrane protein YhfC
MHRLTTEFVYSRVEKDWAMDRNVFRIRVIVETASVHQVAVKIQSVTFVSRRRRISHGQSVFLDAFTKIVKSYYQVHQVRPSVCQSAWNNSLPTGRIFMKFHI